MVKKKTFIKNKLENKCIYVKMYHTHTHTHTHIHTLNDPPFIYHSLSWLTSAV